MYAKTTSIAALDCHGNPVKEVHRLIYFEVLNAAARLASAHASTDVEICVIQHLCLGQLHPRPVAFL